MRDNCTSPDDSQSSSPFLPKTVTTPPPQDSYQSAYVIYFVLGAGYLIPWNTFITAVDYFSYLYPAASVDRVFAIVYMTLTLICLLFIVFYSQTSNSFVRINVGLTLFIISLLVVPVVDATCLLGLTNGYLTSCLLMVAPKTVPLQHSEMAGIVLVVFLVIGLAVGSVVSWFWTM